MFDSDTPGDIPATVEAVALYTTGATQADMDRFTNATVKLWIARHLNEDGDVIDVENYLASPTDAPPWTQRQHSLGRVRPWSYCNLSTKPALFAAMSSAGLALHVDWEWWSAGYFDTQGDPPRLDSDAVATQYGHEPYTGGHYDLSLISDAYISDAHRAAQEEDTMIFVKGDGPSGIVWVASGLSKLRTRSQAEMDAWAANMPDSAIHVYPQFVVDGLPEVSFGENLSLRLDMLEAEVKTIQPGTSAPLKVSLTGTAQP